MITKKIFWLFIVCLSVTSCGFIFTQFGAGSGAATVYKYFVYVANNGASTVSIYELNISTGGLTSLGTTNLGAGVAYGVTSSPNKRYLYVTNSTNNQVYGYSINQSTGLLTALSGSPYANCGGAGTLEGLEVSPNGSCLFATHQAGGTNGICSWTVAADGTLAVAAAAGPAVSNVYEVSVHPDGSIVYVNDATVNALRGFTIGGGCTMVEAGWSPFATLGSPADVQVSPSGSYIFSPANAGAVESKTLTAGAPSVNSAAGGGGSPRLIAINPAGTFIFTNDQGGTNIYTYSVSAAGTVAYVGNQVAGAQVENVEVDPSGQYLLATITTGTINSYAIAANGTLTLRDTKATGTTPYTIEAIRIAQ